ncbi:uncharacterized protein BP5553_08101 [Venustampulla echinocandica]|uniref:Uncharacterized protein n=1 Tax=Venustampulla echinocandica TaxID=2656787 RepID=A0A370TFR0_9HELO|nr:uncharacterized protein BP5553_08101 [Venustampulla echinocandica]RDL33733.1 hypothetical protein BP5553_08101 [Venustampulla echinocandica]
MDLLYAKAMAGLSDLRQKLDEQDRLISILVNGQETVTPSTNTTTHEGDSELDMASDFGSTFDIASSAGSSDLSDDEIQHAVQPPRERFLSTFADLAPRLLGEVVAAIVEWAEAERLMEIEEVLYIASLARCNCQDITEPVQKCWGCDYNICQNCNFGLNIIQECEKVDSTRDASSKGHRRADTLAARRIRSYCGDTACWENTEAWRESGICDCADMLYNPNSKHIGQICHCCYDGLIKCLMQCNMRAIPDWAPRNGEDIEPPMEYICHCGKPGSILYTPEIVGGVAPYGSGQRWCKLRGKVCAAYTLNKSPPQVANHRLVNSGIEGVLGVIRTDGTRWCGSENSFSPWFFVGPGQAQ